MHVLCMCVFVTSAPDVWVFAFSRSKNGIDRSTNKLLGGLLLYPHNSGARNMWNVREQLVKCEGCSLSIPLPPPLFLDIIDFPLFPGRLTHSLTRILSNWKSYKLRAILSRPIYACQTVSMRVWCACVSYSQEWCGFELCAFRCKWFDYFSALPAFDNFLISSLTSRKYLVIFFAFFFAAPSLLSHFSVFNLRCLLISLPSSIKSKNERRKICCRCLNEVECIEAEYVLLAQLYLCDVHRTNPNRIIVKWCTGCEADKIHSSQITLTIRERFASELNWHQFRD